MVVARPWCFPRIVIPTPMCVTDPTGFALADMLLGPTGPQAAKPEAAEVTPKSTGPACPSCGFTLDDLKRFPKTNRTYFLECAANTGMEWRGPQLNSVQYTHGMIHNVVYTGVRLKDVLAEAGLKTSARWLLAEGGDASLMSRSIPNGHDKLRQVRFRWTQVVWLRKQSRPLFQWACSRCIRRSSLQRRCWVACFRL